MDYLDKIEGDNKLKCKEMFLFFQENCPDAKGSSHNHQTWKGGYFDHISDIMNYASILYENLPSLPFSISDVILVLFLHDIEKPIKYSSSNLNFGYTNEEIRNNLISKFDIKLNDIHVNALKYIHGEGDDYKSDKRVMNPLCAFCHCCDIISARIFYDKK